MTQRDGPLTGAPLNFPADPGGAPCCPPAGIWNFDSPLPGGDPAFVMALRGVKLDNVVSVEVREAGPSFGPPGPLPAFIGFVFVPGIPPAMDALDVTLDITGADGAFALVLTNDCGCCQVIPANVVIF